MILSERDIDRALEVSENETPELHRFVRFLSDWRDTVNSYGEGWAYWLEARRPAERLAGLVEELVAAVREGRQPPEERAFENALVHIRSAAGGFALRPPVLGELAGASFGR